MKFELLAEVLKNIMTTCPDIQKRKADKSLSQIIGWLMFCTCGKGMIPIKLFCIPNTNKAGVMFSCRVTFRAKGESHDHEIKYDKNLPHCTYKRALRFLGIR